jgi:hypothetical protein
MFRETTYHVYIYAVVSYLIMTQAPRLQQHKIMVAFLLSYMSFQHLYRMWDNFGGFDMDITTYTMILVIKLWGMSFSYMDGGRKDSEITDR